MRKQQIENAAYEVATQVRSVEDSIDAALTDAEGRQLCECKMSTPLQSGPIPGYIRGILERLGRNDPPAVGLFVRARGKAGGRVTVLDLDDEAAGRVRTWDFADFLRRAREMNPH